MEGLRADLSDRVTKHSLRNARANAHSNKDRST